MRNEDKLREVLEFYRFHEPVPAEARSHILRARKETLKRILREKGKYGLLILLGVNTYYLLKKLGISISLGKSVTIAVTVSLLSATAVTVAAYFTVQYAISGKPGVIEKPEIEEKIKKESEVEKKSSLKTNIDGKPVALKPAVPRPLLNIIPFKHDKSLKNISAQIVKNISSSVKSSKGDWAVTTSVDLPSGKKAGKVLFGSIAKLGDKYIITARLVERKSSRVIQFIKETAESEDEIEDAGKRIISHIKKHLQGL